MKTNIEPCLFPTPFLRLHSFVPNFSSREWGLWWVYNSSSPPLLMAFPCSTIGLSMGCRPMLCHGAPPSPPPSLTFSFALLFLFSPSLSVCLVFLPFLKYFFPEAPPAWLKGLRTQGWAGNRQPCSQTVAYVPQITIHQNGTHAKDGVISTIM